MSLLELVHGVERELEALGDPERAFDMAAYMRDHFEFLGVQSKPRRAATQEALRAARKAEPHELLEAAEWCWSREPRELQYVGSDLIRAGAKNLLPEHLPRLRGLVERKAWWDTVDALAAHGVGALVRNHPALSATMDEWVDDADMWVARTAILHQLAWRDQMQAERLFDYTLRRASDTEFFIRKALGWALRALARREPVAVGAFVEQHRDVLSGLTVREATKHL